MDIKIAVPISIKSLNKVRKYSRKTAANDNDHSRERGEIPRKSPKAHRKRNVTQRITHQNSAVLKSRKSLIQEKRLIATIANKGRCIKSYWNKSSMVTLPSLIMDVKTSPRRALVTNQMNIPILNWLTLFRVMRNHQNRFLMVMPTMMH